MAYLLAIDQGTSSSRAVLFDSRGKKLGVGQQPVDSSFPHDGWVEQDAETLWRSTVAVGREAIEASGVNAAKIAAIGITNQRETTLVWDAETGEAVGNAIVWQDRRTTERCRRLLRDGIEPTIVATTGLVVDPYFSSTKLAWLLDQPGVRRRAETGQLCFGTVDSFLIWRLTKGRRHVTDATNASRTQLFDIDEQVWSHRLLDYFDVPRPMLPTVLDCVAEFGIADREWFGAPIPICGVAGDQQAALVGHACLTEGATKSTYGTGCFVIANTGQRKRSDNRLLATVGYRLNGVPTYALEGSIFNAGVAIKWLRDKLGLIDAPADTEAAALRIGGDTGGVFVVPAFTGLGAPHWQPAARGLIAGLTLDSGRDEIVAATLQSVAYQTADLLAAMAADGVAATVLRIDGGMAANDWFCQFLADITGIRATRPANTETTAAGAALLAAVGSGEYSELETATAAWRDEDEGTTFEPVLEVPARATKLREWRAAVKRTLD